MKNGTTVLQNQDAENSEKCRESQLCVLNEDFEHQGQDSPFRMSTESFREDFQGRQTLQKGTRSYKIKIRKLLKSAVRRNFACPIDIHRSSRLRTKELAISTRTTGLTLKTPHRPIRRRSKKKTTTYNRARAPQKYLFSLILYNLLNHCVHLYSLCKLGTVVQNSRIQGIHLRTFRQEHFTRILCPVQKFCP